MCFLSLLTSDFCILSACWLKGGEESVQMGELLLDSESDHLTVGAKFVPSCLLEDCYQVPRIVNCNLFPVTTVHDLCSSIITFWVDTNETCSQFGP